ncbi:hypothetical protein [uncultured Deinococcus sp.]|uniref:hypothetical protein n=1 Tax=uncultured Deinococcus sp. TaxID=158789 RepID=UPI002587A03A|nr:hypothetical protein [uncultured Deinococcus sp.]
MTDFAPALHPAVIGSLRNFFGRYLQAVRELGLDTSPAVQRGLPEFFLTLPTEEGSPPVILHGLLPAEDRYAPLNNKLDAQVKETGDERLRVILHPATQRDALYQTFAQGGVTRYLHPDAMRALAELRLTWDGYGLLSGVLGWTHALAFLLGVLVLWGIDGFVVSLLAMLVWAAAVGLSYFVFSRLLVVPALQRRLAARRRAACARILADCQEVGRRPLSPRMAAELPAPVMDALSRLPGERPQAQDVLQRGEWWRAELWDLAHEAARGLAKVPESGPDFAARTRGTAALVGRIVQVFELDAASPGVVSPETAWRLDEAYAQVEAQAASLGYAAPLRPRSASPLPQAPFLTPVRPGPALTDPIPKEPHHD